MKKNARVIALFAEDYSNACAYVRITGPYSYLRNRGIVADHAPHSMMQKLVLKGSINPEDYDIFVLPRLADNHTGQAKKLIRDLQGAGKLVVWETDDDYSLKHRQVLQAGYTAMDVAGACDALTVSTHYLADMMKEANDRVYVLPNSIHIPMWQEHVHARVANGLTIGLAGTPTHYDDWKVLTKPVRRILALYKHVNFVIAGFVPDYFQDLPSERVLVIPPMPYEAYPFVIRQIDIGLAPLDPRPKFNLSKSDLKVLEYWASLRNIGGAGWGGAAVIASDMPVYNKTVEHAVTGLLVEHDDSDGWLIAMRQLIEDEELRREIGMSGNAYVRSKRNMKSLAQMWANAYNAIKGGSP